MIMPWTLDGDNLILTLELMVELPPVEPWELSRVHTLVVERKMPSLVRVCLPSLSVLSILLGDLCQNHKANADTSNSWSSHNRPRCRVQR